MAQAGYTPIQLYYSTTASTAPSASNLANGELAINITDGKLYYKDNSGVVQVIGTKGGVGSSTNTQVLFNSSGAVAGAAGLTWDGTNLTVNSIKDSALTSGRVTYAGASGLLQDSANLTWNGTGLGIGGVAAVTAQTFAAGSTLSWGTNLSTIDYIQAGSGSISLGTNGTAKLTIDSAGAVTLSGGTANGVAYLNGSKVLTTGSALTFDGTNLGVGFTANSRGGVVMTTTNNSGTSEQGGYQVTNGNGTGLFAGVNGASFTTGGIGSANNAVLYTIGNTDLVFGRNTSEAMRLTSTSLYTASGINVGIGTSSPSTKLHIAGTAATGAITIFSTGTTTGYNVGQFTNTGGSFFYGVDNSAGTTFSGSSAYASVVGSGNATNLNLVTNATVKATLDSSGNLGLGVTPSTVNTLSGYKSFEIGQLGNSIYAGNNQTLIGTNVKWDGGTAKYAQAASTYAAALYNQQAGAHQWFTAPVGTAGNAITFTQAMTLDASGNLLVGTTSANEAVDIGIRAKAVGQLTSTMAASTNSTDTLDVYSTGAGAYRFYVGMGGNVYATSTTITAISDQRLKENIRNLDDGLASIMALQPRKFDWKEGKGQDIKNARGFIAQEFEKVFPDLIDEWKDPAPEGEEPYKSVRADLIPVLVKAIQEQQTIITELRARVSALETK